MNFLESKLAGVLLDVCYSRLINKLLVAGNGDDYHYVGDNIDDENCYDYGEDNDPQ